LAPGTNEHVGVSEATLCAIRHGFGKVDMDGELNLVGMERVAHEVSEYLVNEMLPRFQHLQRRNAKIKEMI